MKVAILGFGFMGKMHAQVFQALPGVELAAVVTGRPPRARAWLKKAGTEVPVYDDHETVLADPTIDAVDVCLPTDLHESRVVAALRAGKHVFCEKPLASTLKECAAMVEEAERAGTVFMVGHCLRFWPEYQAFADFVWKGRAGRLLSLTLRRAVGRPAYSTGNWLLDTERSLGSAFDLHIHDTDFVLHLLGRPAAVASTGVKDEAGWSQIFTRYEYPDGPLVQAEGGWIFPPKWDFRMDFRAVFENGAVAYDSAASPTLTYAIGNGAPKPLAFREPPAGESRETGGNVSSLGGYMNELAAFVEAVRLGRPPPTATGREAMESVEVVLAEIRSAEHERPIRLPEQPR
ncbi:MAG: gfo/Idh/MocA family oxidoreductase [Puniceicoccaceae bacterium]|nr:MAG: gfo/Idh/MocA family oxidoreductase [Puniceicoccaceae bacterium]